MQFLKKKLLIHFHTGSYIKQCPVVVGILDFLPTNRIKLKLRFNPMTIHVQFGLNQVSSWIFPIYLKIFISQRHLEFLWSSVAQSLVFCVVCCWLLFVPFLLVIALSVIRLLWCLIISNCYLQIVLIIFNQMLKYWIEQIPNL